MELWIYEHITTNPLWFYIIVIFAIALYVFLRLRGNRRSLLIRILGLLASAGAMILLGTVIISVGLPNDHLFKWSMLFMCIPSGLIGGTFLSCVLNV